MEYCSDASLLLKHLNSLTARKQIDMIKLQHVCLMYVIMQAHRHSCVKGGGLGSDEKGNCVLVEKFRFVAVAQKRLKDTKTKRQVGRVIE